MSLRNALFHFKDGFGGKGAWRPDADPRTTEWKERANPSRLLSDFYWGTHAHRCGVCAHTTHTNMCKNVLKSYIDLLLALPSWNLKTSVLQIRRNNLSKRKWAWKK